jgi:hypothetical protein
LTRRQELVAAQLDDSAADARMLARQRAAIYARLDDRKPLWLRWMIGAPVAVAAAALVISVTAPRLAERPQQESVVEEASLENDHFFTDVYQTVSQPTPASMAPVDGMFEQ